MTADVALSLALLAKARRACASARLLLDAGDVDGATNRSYYAMFDAARAALLNSGLSDEEVGRTHRGLIGTFSRRLVQAGTVDKELGRLLNRAEEARLAADYRGDSVGIEDAQDLVAQAELFVAAMEALCGPADPQPGARLAQP